MLEKVLGDLDFKIVCLYKNIEGKRKIKTLELIAEACITMSAWNAEGSITGNFYSTVVSYKRKVLAWAPFLRNIHSSSNG